MTIIWGGLLTVVLSVLRKNPSQYMRLKFSVEEQIKRLGVYYMCLSDIFL